MKQFLYLSFILISACAPSEKPSRNSNTVIVNDDDYVLIEFASKLEEDYHRIDKKPANPAGHGHTKQNEISNE